MVGESFDGGMLIGTDHYRIDITGERAGCIPDLLASTELQVLGV